MVGYLFIVYFFFPRVIIIIRDCIGNDTVTAATTGGLWRPTVEADREEINNIFANSRGNSSDIKKNVIFDLLKIGLVMIK